MRTVILAWFDLSLVICAWAVWPDRWRLPRRAPRFPVIIDHFVRGDLK